ncbi:hypothetical protein NUW54_g9192 [Trametes sanguinea]|uniref:Uncharacterized protein n=1 Tax=Trametes sanguinea TaxID=158606 RepID=A0ACC1P8T2_9APHY|nr:hypothetical protein NUW54_g9192 [Trametes sanguinea]
MATAPPPLRSVAQPEPEVPACQGRAAVAEVLAPKTVRSPARPMRMMSMLKTMEMMGEIYSRRETGRVGGSVKEYDRQTA